MKVAAYALLSPEISVLSISADSERVSALARKLSYFCLYYSQSMSLSGKTRRSCTSVHPNPPGATEGLCINEIPCFVTAFLNNFLGLCLHLHVNTSLLGRLASQETNLKLK